MDKKGLSKEYLELCQKNVQALLKTLNVGVTKEDRQHDNSVYMGTSGYSLLFLHLAQHRVDNTYLKKALNILLMSLSDFMALMVLCLSDVLSLTQTLRLSEYF